ncbi:hypothetical protein B0H13DRAFT_2342688 [Mycena leptocephala]|nr:hypothetical protein B0H13DRAFT_2342688 [Mycena leptocephala]
MQADQGTMMRAALEVLSTTADIVKGASAAVGDAPLSPLSDLAAAANAVSDAAAQVTAAATSFLTSPTPGPVAIATAPPPGQPLDAVPDNNDKWFAITSGKYIGLTKNAAISLNAAEALDHFNSALEGGAVVIVR